MVVAGKDPRKVKLLREAAKQELAARDFKYFLDFVFIQERPQLQEGIVGGKRQFEKWPHVMEIADALLNDRKIVILKARQLGASWVGAAYACWMFMFHPGSLVGMFSRGEREAVRLMAKVKFIYKNLPRGWTRSLETDSRLEMQLNFAEGVESIITAFPSTSDAGRGDDFSLVVMDEADSHEALEEAYTALSGSIDSTGGQMVMMSTINKLRAESVFVEAYTGSPENNWKKLFFGWRARPTRNDEWYQRARNNIPTTSKLTAELYMEQEFELLFHVEFGGQLRGSGYVVTRPLVPFVVSGGSCPPAEEQFFPVVFRGPGICFYEHGLRPKLVYGGHHHHLTPGGIDGTRQGGIGFL